MTTNAAGSGFYGNMLIGDPPATASHAQHEPTHIASPDDQFILTDHLGSPIDFSWLHDYLASPSVTPANDDFAPGDHHVQSEWMAIFDMASHANDFGQLFHGLF